MKIFFIASIHGKEKFEKNYSKIINVLEDLGHEVQADHVLGISKQDIDHWTEKDDINFHKKILKGIKNADVIVSEISSPSISVGYLISLGVEAGVPTIALYSNKEKPHLLRTLESEEKFTSSRYELGDDLEKVLENLTSLASGQQDTRFNFFISPHHQAYLDWIARERKIPRSVFLRRLIEEHMHKNKDYSEA